jgi:beta-galactosidase
MAHVLPHWTWPERHGQVTPVHVFTSGSEAELFLNGRSLGRKMKGALEYRLRWDDVVYEPGMLDAIAYKDGKIWARDMIRTAAAPARLEATADRDVIAADGRDLSFVTVRVLDGNGVLTPRADNKLRFRVDGPGEIVATDNGDPTCFVPFPSHEREAFNGLALVIVRATKGEPGRVTVTVTGDGLSDGVAVITTAARHR